MYCHECGTKVADDSTFCYNCGTRLQGGVQNTRSAPVHTYSQNSQRNTSGNNVIRIAGIVVLVLAVVVFAINMMDLGGKNSLHEQLQRDWSRTEEGGITMILDFSEDGIEYYFDSQYVPMELLYEYDYEVTSGNTIRINNYSTEYKVTFNQAKTMMTITPAFTTTGDSETWFNFN